MSTQKLQPLRAREDPNAPPIPGPSRVLPSDPLLLPLLRPPPSPAHSRIREGPGAARPPVAAEEAITLRVRRVDKDALDRIRTDLSVEGRVLPLWEAFARVIDHAERRRR